MCKGVLRPAVGWTAAQVRRELCGSEGAWALLPKAAGLNIPDPGAEVRAARRNNERDSNT